MSRAESEDYKGTFDLRDFKVNGCRRIFGHPRGLHLEVKLSDYPWTVSGEREYRANLAFSIQSFTRMFGKMCLV